MDSSSAVDPVAARARSLGLQVDYASSIVPVIWVTGSAGRIRRLALDRRRGVRRLALDLGVRLAVRADPLWRRDDAG